MMYREVAMGVGEWWLFGGVVLAVIIIILIIQTRPPNGRLAW